MPQPYYYCHEYHFPDTSDWIRHPFNELPNSHIQQITGVYYVPGTVLDPGATVTHTVIKLLAVWSLCPRSW